MEKIKECPFCGCLPEYKKGFPMENLHMVICDNRRCGIKPCGMGVTEKEALEKWNKRV